LTAHGPVRRPYSDGAMASWRHDIRLNARDESEQICTALSPGFGHNASVRPTAPISDRTLTLQNAGETDL
jgi:hypothetical protein